MKKIIAVILIVLLSLIVFDELYKIIKVLIGYLEMDVDLKDLLYYSVYFLFGIIEAFLFLLIVYYVLFEKGENVLWILGIVLLSLSLIKHLSFAALINASILDLRFIWISLSFLPVAVALSLRRMHNNFLVTLIFLIGFGSSCYYLCREIYFHSIVSTSMEITVLSLYKMIVSSIETPKVIGLVVLLYYFIFNLFKNEEKELYICKTPLMEFFFCI